MDPTREQMEEAEAYLRTLNLPEDEWILNSPQRFRAVSEVAGHMFGLDEDAVRNAAKRGEIPYVVMPNPSIGWRLPCGGLIWYMAQQRRKQEQRRAGMAGHARMPGGEGARTPRKLRGLWADLRREGWAIVRQRGSHETWRHPLVPLPVVLAGKDRDDADRYQERGVRNAIQASRDTQRRQHP